MGIGLCVFAELPCHDDRPVKPGILRSHIGFNDHIHADGPLPILNTHGVCLLLLLNEQVEVLRQARQPFKGDLKLNLIPVTSEKICS